MITTTSGTRSTTIRTSWKISRTTPSRSDTLRGNFSRLLEIEAVELG